MSKYNNGTGCHNGIEMSEADLSAVFVKKISPLLALGNWQAFCQGFVAYGETRQDAIAKVKSEANFEAIEESEANFEAIEELD